MTEQNHELHQIAEQAVDQLNLAQEQLDWLCSTLHVVREHLLADPAAKHYAGLLGMAIYNTDDWHNELELAGRQLAERLKAAGEGQP